MFTRGLLKCRNVVSHKILFRCNSALSIGSKANITKIFSQDDVMKFAELTGDLNPLHTNVEFAKSTNVFAKPVVHGAMLVGLVSALLGTKLPGHGSIVVEQNLKYPKPLYVDQKVTAEVEITKIKLKFVTCKIECTSDNVKVLTGNALLLYSPPSSH